MPIRGDIVGLKGTTVSETLEDRWVSNYAAAVSDTNDVYFDNTGGALPAHPAYLSHIEWDAIGRLHEKFPMLETEIRQGVHSFNHTILHQPLHAGDCVEASAALVGVERSRRGTRLTIKIDTSCDGECIATSFTQTVFRGVELDGEETRPELPEIGSTRDSGTAAVEERVETLSIGALLPYHFSECARDYGAIHTDRRIAEAAGLPGLILHGTATFALALSSIINHEAGGDPCRVAEFGGSLKSMVLCPSTASLHVAGCPGGTVRFTVLNSEGDPALANGFVTFRTES